MMNEHQTGQVAATAAEMYETFFVPALFIDWPAHVLQAAGTQVGDTILDVACGTGVVARQAAEIVGIEDNITGVDINDGMLAVARQKAPNINWKEGAAEALPFEDHSFDRVVSQFGLMFFQDQVKALAEMGRVVRPSGRIAVAVWDTLQATPGYAVVAEILDELFGAEIAQSIEAPYSLGDTEKLLGLFTAAGLQDVKVETVKGTARFASVDAWIYTDIKAWTLADVIDDAEYERLKQYAPQKLSQFVQADGSVAFDAPAHIVTAVAK